MMFEVRRYSQQDSLLWNRFVEKARNATFLFHRDYMDYHADRFNDYSLMFFKQGKLYALLPAHLKETTLYSHFGLTYGGLIMGMDVTIVDTCQLFDALNEFLVKQGITKVVYRPVPWIYHLHPSEEDLYAIFWRCHATLSLRNIGTSSCNSNRNGERIISEDSRKQKRLELRWWLMRILGNSGISWNRISSRGSRQNPYIHCRRCYCSKSASPWR